MNRITIEVSSMYPGEAWRAHLASELAVLHPGACVRVAQGLADDVFVWDDEFGLCEEALGERTSVVGERASIFDAFVSESRDSFAAVVLAAEDLTECVERECAAILRAWTGRGRGPLKVVADWVKSRIGK